MSETAHPQPNGTLLAAAGSEQPTRPATEMLELARPECLRLLAATGIGRVAVSVTGWDHPVIRPVNYVFDESSQCVASLGAGIQASRPSALGEGGV